MSSFKKLMLSIAAGIVLSSGLVMPARAVSPSAGTAAVGRNVARDGNGNLFGNNFDIGFKVWVATDVGPHQITDELGNVVTSGLIHQVCVSSGAVGEWAVVYDSGSATNSLTLGNYTTNNVLELHPPVVRVTTGVTCMASAPDAQFNNGAIVLQSAITLGGQTFVYWRPGRGGTQ